MRFEFDDAEKAIAQKVAANVKARVAPMLQKGRPFAEAGVALAFGVGRLVRAVQGLGDE